ncbi:MAG: hypothetical protein RL318_661, partial [Fibrobacterota bacterium]
QAQSRSAAILAKLRMKELEAFANR